MACGVWGLPSGTGGRNGGTSKGWLATTTTDLFGSMSGNLTGKQFRYKAKS